MPKDEPAVTNISSIDGARPRFCLCGTDFDGPNLGLRALTTGIIMALRCQHRDAGIEMLEYGKDKHQYRFDLPAGPVDVEMRNIRFSKRLWVRNHVVRLILSALVLRRIPRSWFRKFVCSRDPWIQSLLQADSFLALNYGDSFSDIYGLQRFVYVCLPQILAILLEVPLVQLPQTIGPFESRACRAVARWILVHSSLVYARDEESLAAARLLLPAARRSRARLCHDLAFLVPPAPYPSELPVEEAFARGPVVGLNVSGLLWMGGYTKANMFNLVCDYKQLVRLAIAELMKTPGLTVLLVPHIISTSGEGDTPACDAVFAELAGEYPRRLLRLTPPYDERQVKGIIARCEFFMGARMHSCIGALSVGVPTVGMAYSRKFAGVFRSVGMGSCVIDLRATSIEEALSAIIARFESRKELKAVLGECLPEVTRTILQCAEACGSPESAAANQ